MRLIDADALFINLDGMMAVSPTGYIHGDTVADMISDAPTVDAVPVSFLLKLQETAVNDESSEIINEIIARWERERNEK